MVREQKAHVGLIPAHAGSTVVLEYDKAVGRAHPRSRGEHFKGVLETMQGWGSSPLTRGARYGIGDGDGNPRLIPAHAGSTRSVRAAASPCPAHPRSRGEHRARTYKLQSHLGSSPLTRGAQVFLV